YSPDRGDNFLYSPVRKDIKLGFEASYEIIHDFFAKAFYSYSDITDENLTRTPSFLLGKKHSFGFTVHYGM
ncbi:MAG: hypothetical protein Q7S39_10730, partial [Ignavibacteria bacterium]|nr:hypothetical protein [Ignavibacteria bacterium]